MKGLKSKSYAEKLRDPRWQQKRLEILNRDNWACRDCGAKDKELHVHHKLYKKNTEPWDYPNDSFLSLCGQCHEAAGENVARFDEVFKSRFHHTHLKRIADHVFTSDETSSTAIGLAVVALLCDQDLMHYLMKRRLDQIFDAKPEDITPLVDQIKREREAGNA